GVGMGDPSGDPGDEAEEQDRRDRVERDEEPAHLASGIGSKPRLCQMVQRPLVARIRATSPATTSGGSSNLGMRFLPLAITRAMSTSVTLACQSAFVRSGAWTSCP